MSGKKKASAGGSMSRLGELLQRAGIKPKSAEKTPAPSHALPPKSDAKPKELFEESDDKLFESAMGSVERMGWKHETHPLAKPPRMAAKDTEAENRKLMQEAMNEDSPLTIPDHPEYIEGWIGVAGKQYIPNLRNGLYSIQGQIDLHGLNRVEAQTAVEEYIVRMSRFRPCCIKIIHGRGINSPADQATLKDSLQRLLATRKMSHYVVAYASAAYRDGGVGAVYVLLSRQ